MKHLMFIVLIVLVMGLACTNHAKPDSKQDNMEQQSQELRLRLSEEETAHNLTKREYEALEQRLSALLFDNPEEMRMKTYIVQLYEEKFRIRFSEENISWDTHEVYIIGQIFRSFPKEVQEYFLREESPLLTIKIENSLLAPDQSVANGLYYACSHTISLSRKMLRGSSTAFPSEAEIRAAILHEFGHAYDRSRALAELKETFYCKVPALSYYSIGNNEYAKLIESGGNVQKQTTFDTHEELVIENFGEVFRQYATYGKRQMLESDEAEYQRAFFYKEVFCKEYLRVLDEFEKENSHLLAENPFLFYELRDTALELAGSHYFCS